METLRRIFEREGFSFMCNTKEDNSFFHCLYSAKTGSHSVASKNAKQMQKELYEFEEKNSMHFHMYQPHYVECDGDHSATDCLKREFEKMRKEKRSPSPREVFAAAEILHKNVCLYRCNEFDQPDIEDLEGYIFAPANKNGIDKDPACIIMVEKRTGSKEFAFVFHSKLIEGLDMCPGMLKNRNHTHCFGTRYANDFSRLFGDGFPQWHFNPKKEIDLYRLLSLVFYGHQGQHSRILNIVCKCELEDDNLDLFCKYVENSINDETSLSYKRNVLKNHVEHVKKENNLSGEGEFYALASVFNVDIIIDETGTKDWERYMPVVCTSASCFDSPVILHKEREARCYLPYFKEPKTCSCCQEIPEILGHTGKVKASINEAVLKKPCCPPERPGQSHTHLKNRQNPNAVLPPGKDYRHPLEGTKEEIELINARLKEECRQLDHTHGGKKTLAAALAIELYGVENEKAEREMRDAIGDENLELDEKLFKLSDWLNVPIYVYYCIEPNDDQKRYLWVKYESVVCKKDNECRFYITLFYDWQHKLFDRITPLQGCNCQIPPPISLLLNSQKMEGQYIDMIHPKTRHHPLVTSLSKEPDENKIKVEVRDFPLCSPFSVFKMAIDMDTMTERTFDCLQIRRHSLFRCLSKEIFGTEDNYEILQTELTNELLQNFAHYIPKIGENIRKAFKTVKGGELDENSRKDREKLAELIKGRIDDDLPCDELLLWLTCTFFQTPVYVFRIYDIENYEKGVWTVYEKLYRRGIRASRVFRNKCQREGVYYISLLETGMKLYHRIIPKSKLCNCMLKKPSCIPQVADTTKYHSPYDYELMRSLREMDNYLTALCVEIDQWLLCNQLLQNKCERLVIEIEGRRKNVNIATITGTSAGIVGAALTGVGIALIPFTAGLSTLLSVGGTALAVSGGTVATGAKVAESILNSDNINLLKQNQNCYQERLEAVKTLMDKLKNALLRLNKISSEMQGSQHLKASDFANVQSIPGILRTIEGILMIPIAVLRISVRGVLILSAVIGPLTALVDTALLVFSAINLAKGNKTDITENLRRTSAVLFGSRRQMHNWAYGTEQQFTYK